MLGDVQARQRGGQVIARQRLGLGNQFFQKPWHIPEATFFARQEVQQSIDEAGVAQALRHLCAGHFKQCAGHMLRHVDF